MKFKTKKGQSTAEYAVLVLLVVAAITTMNVFLKRGQQGAIRFVVLNHLVNTGKDSLDGTVQFEPYYTESKLTSETNQAGWVNIVGGGKTASRTESTTRITSGYENTLGVEGNTDINDWGWNQTLN